MSADAERFSVHREEGQLERGLSDTRNAGANSHADPQIPTGGGLADVDPPLPPPAGVMLLAVVGALLGVGIAALGARADAGSAAFVDTPQFLVWLLLIAAQTALWAIAAAVFLASARRLRTRYAGGGVRIWATTVAFLLAVLFVAAAPIFAVFVESPLLHQRYRSGVLGILGAAVAAVGAHVVARIAAAADAASELSLDGRLERFLFLRNELQLVLFFLGAMVGAATLASGALRHALIDRGRTAAGEFPPEIVLAYGAYFSLLLTALYVPAYREVLGLGRDIRDDICGRLPARPEEADSWSEWRDRRAPVEEFLELNRTATQRLQTGLAIVAPLAGGAVSLVIGAGE